MASKPQRKSASTSKKTSSKKKSAAKAPAKVKPEGYQLPDNAIISFLRACDTAIDEQHSPHHTEHDERIGLMYDAFRAAGKAAKEAGILTDLMPLIDELGQATICYLVDEQVAKQKLEQYEITLKRGVVGEQIEHPGYLSEQTSKSRQRYYEASYKLRRWAFLVGDVNADDLPERTKPKRRKRDDGDIKPITSKQAEAIHLMGECKGNIADVARRMGVSYATAQQHCKAAYKKLGKAGVNGHHVDKPKTHKMPVDNRGQELV